MRNGDFNPTRMSAQQDATNLLCGRKTQSNPETTVAILTMAGSSPSVQVALTTDLGKLLSSLSQVKISGKINFSTSIKVAQLALKRRSSEQSSNKRIVAFIGSPLEETREELDKLGLRLKKNNIAVDVISFGEMENSEKLESFINSVNNSDNRYVCAPCFLRFILLNVWHHSVFFGNETTNKKTNSKFLLLLLNIQKTPKNLLY